MDTEKELRKEQRRREKYQYEHNFELFGNRMSQKNPLNNTNSKKKGSYIWEEELRPFFTENINILPAIITNNICEKFKSIGSGILDNELKREYKSYVQKFIRENVRLLIFLTIKTTLDIYFARTRKEKKTKYAFAVTAIGQEFLNYAIFYDKNKTLADASTDIKQMKIPEKNNSIDPIQRDFLHIASYFLDVAIENQQVIKTEKSELDKNTHLITLTPKFLEYYDPKNNFAHLFRPTKLPMICLPNGWDTTLHGGGYLSYPKTNLVSVKSKNQLTSIKNNIKASTKKPIFLSAANTLQQTRWKINTKILETLNHFYKCPEDFGTDLSKKNLLQQMFAIANDFKNEKFYIPWYLDFRGRMYTSITSLSPQSHDEGRSLLLFATPQSITKSNEEQALKNLAIYGFNKYKPTSEKHSIQEMFSWIENNEYQISKSASDPIKNCDFWQQASDKYSFLAFCFEWRKIKNSPPETRCTSLPVYVDGTCNGFQHYAALLRDEKVAPLVNLIDAERPGDFYQSAVDKMRIDVVSPKYDFIIEYFVSNHINRKSIKTSIISAGYGAHYDKRARKISRYLYDCVPKQKRPEGSPPPAPSNQIDEEGKNTAYLFAAEKIEIMLNSVIRKLCPSFVKVRSWLNKTCELITEKNQCISWTNPADLFVQNYYYDFPLFEVRLFLGKKSTQFLFADFNATKGLTVDEDGIGRAIAPNFIHSLDSAHAAHIITTFAHQQPSDGNIPIASVHDSFATYATHIDELQKVIRETFVQIHSQNQLEILKSQVEQRFGIQAPPLPPMGKLDINSVLASKFFFC